MAEGNLEVRVAKIEERLEATQDDVKEILVALQGPPRDGSIRDRLHKLENDSAAARAAHAAIEATKLVRDQMGDRRFSRLEKLAALSLAFVLASCTLVSTILLITNTQ